MIWAGTLADDISGGSLNDTDQKNKPKNTTTEKKKDNAIRPCSTCDEAGLKNNNNKRERRRRRERDRQTDRQRQRPTM